MVWPAATCTCTAFSRCGAPTSRAAGSASRLQTALKRWEWPWQLPPQHLQRFPGRAHLACSQLTRCTCAPRPGFLVQARRRLHRLQLVLPSSRGKGGGQQPPLQQQPSSGESKEAEGEGVEEGECRKLLWFTSVAGAASAEYAEYAQAALLSAREHAPSLVPVLIHGGEPDPGDAFAAWFRRQGGTVVYHSLSLLPVFQGVEREDVRRFLIDGKVGCRTAGGAATASAAGQQLGGGCGPQVWLS